MNQMSIDEFSMKHEKLIKRGVITITSDNPKINDFIKFIKAKLNESELKEYIELLKSTKLFNDSDIYITIDRFVDGNFIADKNELTSPRNDVLKMGFIKTFGIGVYHKPKNK